LPYIPAAGELKTKPTQHSVKELRSIGIQPDLLLCRSDRPVPPEERRKIALFCNVRPTAVIQALDVPNIYDVPIAYHHEGLDNEVLDAFGLSAPLPDLTRWKEISERIANPDGHVNVAVVGKYTGMSDAYKSLIQALIHGGIANRVGVNINWINAEALEKGAPASQFENVHGILVPGGFGERGTQGKIEAARYARLRNVPYFGICFGMQMAVIETARHVAGINDASSTEFGETQSPVVGLMTEWLHGEAVERREAHGNLGGTMRLGSYPAHLAPGSLAARIYGKSDIVERHRHRYEVNINYRPQLEAAGMRFSGLSPDGMLPEIVEIPSHPWFIGVQFHPELKSRPFDPHPLFASFIQAAVVQSRLV
jgi:CTP synthase